MILTSMIWGNMMDANQYQQLAARTLIDGPDFEISDRDFMIVWCMAGVVGEAGELNELIYGSGLDHLHRPDTIKVRGEVGDSAWYLAGICTKLGISFGDVVADAMNMRTINRRGPIGLLRSAATIAELVKKGIFHQHGLDLDAVREQLVFSIRCLVNICDSLSISFPDVLDSNIEKLKARYPDGWDHTRSSIREGEAR